MAISAWLKWPKLIVPDVNTTAAPIIDYISLRVEHQSVEELWTEQPHLRTVVDFLARNIAQLGLQAFERQDDGGRERVRDSTLSTLLRRPSPQQTGYELVRALVSDLALYDNAYLMILRRSNTEPGAPNVELRTIRPSWITGTVKADAYAVEAYNVRFPDHPGSFSIPAKNVLHFHGWQPAEERFGSSAVHSLKAILAEQIHSTRFREQVWKRGGRINAFVTRPATAPAMTPEARTKFQRQFNEAYAGDGGYRSGGVPFLDEGAELKQLRFSAKEEQWVEATKLSLQTVAAVYHVNPTMVGLLDNANYSNVREFRRMLYGETLGPIIRQIEDRLNAFLLPMLGIDDGRVYVEFNVTARLRGSQEEQAAVAAAAVGAPYMTINEYRALQNLPAVEGGDALVQPLNVTQSGSHDPVPAELNPDDPGPDGALMRELQALSSKEGY